MFNINSRKLRRNLHDLGQAVNMIITGRWLFYCIIIGVFAGLFALLFNVLFELIQEIAIHQLAGTTLVHPGYESILEDLAIPLDLFGIRQPWLLFFLPALGGLISGLIVYKFAPQAKGHGNDAVIQAYHSSVDLKSNIPFTKLLASVFTIGTGGSAGKEGPIAQIGAGIGSYVSKKLDMGDVIITADIMVPPKLLKLNDSFAKALDYFRESGEPELPVLRSGSDRQFIGVLSEREFLLKYEEAMSRSRG